MNKLPNNTEHHKHFKACELLKLGKEKSPSAKTKEKICPDTDVIEIPHNIFQESKDKVIEEIFEDFKANSGNLEYFQSRMFLAATNQIVNEVNNEVLGRMPGDLHYFTSVNTVDDLDEATMFPTEYLKYTDTESLGTFFEHELNHGLPRIPCDLGRA